MNRSQKIAWFNLTVMGISLILTALTVGIVYYITGSPKAWSGLGFLGLCGFMGFSPLLFRQSKTQKVGHDERDILIEKKAALAGFACCYGYFCIFCMLTWELVGHDGQIPVRWLPLALCGGFLIMETTRSLTLLQQYGWGTKSE